MIGSCSVGNADTGEVAGTVSLPQFGEAKVQQLRAHLAQNDVARLQIAVRDAFTMRLVQGVGDLDRVEQDLLESERPFLQPLGQGIAFHVPITK